jgi:hypothetical protein
VPERTVPLIQERIYEPARQVEVEYQGRWTPGLQRSWHRWDDDRGWVADVEVTVTCPWGVVTRVLVVPASQVRLATSPAGQPAHDRATAAVP